MRLRREISAFVMLLVTGLMVAAAKRDDPSPNSAEHDANLRMVHLPGCELKVGIEATEIARLQRIFSVAVRELFEAAVPRHAVTVHSFFIDKYLVTNSEFKRFVDAHPEWQAARLPPALDNGNYLKHWIGGSFPAGKANHPVVNVNWYAAAGYCQSQGMRLPSEAEWEYAARGGFTSPLFPWGDEAANPKLANYSASGLHTTTTVGSYPANGYGIFDMAGNVWEFMADEWSKYPTGGRSLSGTRADLPNSFMDVRTRRVIRGGSYDGDPINLWVDYRDSHPPNGSQPFVGFRCAK